MLHFSFTQRGDLVPDIYIIKVHTLNNTPSNFVLSSLNRTLSWRLKVPTFIKKPINLIIHTFNRTFAIMQTYKLIAIDIDGTLVKSDQTISPRTIETLIRVQKQGVKVTICSGRPAYGIAPHADTLRLAEFGGYVISYNGGGICNKGGNLCPDAQTRGTALSLWMHTQAWIQHPDLCGRAHCGGR